MRLWTRKDKKGVHFNPSGGKTGRREGGELEQDSNSHPTRGYYGSVLGGIQGAVRKQAEKRHGNYQIEIVAPKGARRATSTALAEMEEDRRAQENQIPDSLAQKEKENLHREGG